MRNKARLSIVLLLLAFGVAACSSNTKVGTGLKTGVTGGSGLRLGETTTTAAPKETTTTARPVATTVRAVTTTVVMAALQIHIKSASPQFDPAVGAVRVGSVVQWINSDTQARSVVADDGTFTSPMIAPGGSWNYKATTAGSFNYHDGTRPYAVGQLQVS